MSYSIPKYKEGEIFKSFLVSDCAALLLIEMTQIRITYSFSHLLVQIRIYPSSQEHCVRRTF